MTRSPEPGGINVVIHIPARHFKQWAEKWGGKEKTKSILTGFIQEKVDNGLLNTSYSTAPPVLDLDEKVDDIMQSLPPQSRPQPRPQPSQSSQPPQLPQSAFKPVPYYDDGLSVNRQAFINEWRDGVAHLKEVLEQAVAEGHCGYWSGQFTYSGEEPRNNVNDTLGMFELALNTSSWEDLGDQQQKWIMMARDMCRKYLAMRRRDNAK